MPVAYDRVLPNWRANKWHGSVWITQSLWFIAPNLHRCAQPLLSSLIIDILCWCFSLFCVPLVPEPTNHLLSFLVYKLCKNCSRTVQERYSWTTVYEHFLNSSRVRLTSTFYIPHTQSLAALFIDRKYCISEKNIKHQSKTNGNNVLWLDHFQQHLTWC